MIKIGVEISEIERRQRIEKENKTKSRFFKQIRKINKNFSQTDQEKKRIVKLAIVEMREVTTSQIF